MFFQRHSNFKQICCTAFVQLALLPWSFAQATQESPVSSESAGQPQPASVETQAATQTRTQAATPGQAARPYVKYMDVPVIHEAGIDPVLPAFDYGEPLPRREETEDTLLQSLADYEASVEEVEAAGGVWDQALVEQLTALGDVHQQLGDYVAAVETLDRAMHVSRISSGLHTGDQIPIVEDLIESYQALELWEQADLYHNYLFFVHIRAFGPEDPRMIPALERLALWQQQAFNLGFGETPPGLRLSSAQALFEAAAGMVEFHFGPSDERYVPYLLQVANAAYQIAQNPDLMSAIDSSEYRNARQLLAAQLNRPRRANQAGYRAGENALQQIVAVYERSGEDVYAWAEAVTNLGDWYLLFGRRRTAEAQYVRAWELLAGEDNGEELQAKLFGQVVRIPTFDDQPRVIVRRGGTARTLPSQLRESFVDLSFNVNRFGETRNVQLSTPQPPERYTLVVRVQREIRQTRFRPVMEDGKSVSTEGNHARIRFWY